jgi:hypothetical protein
VWNEREQCQGTQIIYIQKRRRKYASNKMGTIKDNDYECACMHVRNVKFFFSLFILSFLSLFFSFRMSRNLHSRSFADYYTHEWPHF